MQRSTYNFVSVPVSWVIYFALCISTSLIVFNVLASISCSLAISLLFHSICVFDFSLLLDFGFFFAFDGIVFVCYCVFFLSPFLVCVLFFRFLCQPKTKVYIAITAFRMHIQLFKQLQRKKIEAEKKVADGFKHRMRARAYEHKG